MVARREIEEATTDAQDGGVLTSQLADVAGRIYDVMQDRGLTQTDLMRRFNAARPKVLTTKEARNATPPLSNRWSLNRILQARLPDTDAIKKLSVDSVRVFAEALGTSAEYLLGGPDPSSAFVLWDPLSDPSRAQKLLDLMSLHEQRASTVVGWSRAIPCSLTSGEFMEAYHLAIFGQDAAGCAAASLYNGVGRIRRERFLGSRRRREWDLTQIMFCSDLAAIIEGSQPYDSIPAELRHQCIRDLRGLIVDRTTGVQLVVADESKALRYALQIYDSVIVFGRSLAVWRDYAGNVRWSSRDATVRETADLLGQIRYEATHHQPDSVVSFLDAMLAR
ncbi:MAG TPA: hypothetical protein VEL28_07310 [Candidatus Binatia bacterium]|nr:hypothetical protein [Candidatus Binatia bacterium]